MSDVAIRWLGGVAVCTGVMLVVTLAPVSSYRWAWGGVFGGCAGYVTGRGVKRYLARRRSR